MRSTLRKIFNSEAITAAIAVGALAAAGHCVWDPEVTHVALFGGGVAAAGFVADNLWQLWRFAAAKRNNIVRAEPEIGPAGVLDLHS